MVVNVEQQLGKARADFAAGRFENVKQTCRRVLAAEPMAFEVRRVLIEALVADQSFDEAIAEGLFLTRHDGASSSAHRMLGLAYVRKGLNHQARQSLKRALEIDTMDAEARKLLEEIDQRAKKASFRGPVTALSNGSGVSARPPGASASGVHAAPMLGDPAWDQATSVFDMNAAINSHSSPPRAPSNAPDFDDIDSASVVTRMADVPAAAASRTSLPPPLPAGGGGVGASPIDPSQFEQLGGDEAERMRLYTKDIRFSEPPKPGVSFFETYQQLVQILLALVPATLLGLSISYHLLRSLFQRDVFKTMRSMPLAWLGISLGGVLFILYAYISFAVSMQSFSHLLFA